MESDRIYLEHRARLHGKAALEEYLKDRFREIEDSKYSLTSVIFAGDIMERDLAVNCSRIY